MNDKKNNTGDRNTGNWNAGNRNAGNINAGDRNTGNWNAGSMNTGDMNTGERNAGLFCTNEPTARLFNKPCIYTMTELYQSDKMPDFSVVKSAVWVWSDAMTDEEKSDHLEYKTTGGYLKQLEYTDAWAKAWPNIPESEKEKLKNLPNFDADIFMEITGIDIRRDQIVEIDGKKYRRADVAERIKKLTPIE